MTYAFTPETLAERWEVSAATVRNLVRDGTLRAFRVGKQIRIRPDDVTAYEESQCETNGGSSSIAGSMPPSGHAGARRNASRSAPPIYPRRDDGSLTTSPSQPARR